MKEILQLNNIEYVEGTGDYAYTTECPKCSGDRKKSGTKTLKIWSEDPLVIWECFHTPCEYNKRTVRNVNSKLGKEGLTEFVGWDEDGDMDDFQKEMYNKAIKYKYYSKSGILMYVKLRINDYPTKGQKWIRPLALTATNKYVFQEPDGAMPYGYDKFLADKDRQVLVVEGEKAVEAAQKIFTKCTVVGIQGVNSITRFDWSFLKGKEVTLWPDADIEGVKAMNNLAKIIDSDKVSLVNPSMLPKGADLADEIDKETIKEIWNSREYVDNSIDIDGAATAEAVAKDVAEFSGLMDTGLVGLDEHIKLPPEGLVIVEGRTNHGKTALMLNMAYNLLQSTTKPIVFVSYEIPRASLVAKFAMRERMDAAPKMDKYLEELKDQSVVQNMKFGKELNKRLFILDSQVDLDGLKNILAAPGMEEAIVFLDYAQLIPSNNAYKQRYLQIKDSVEQLRVAACDRGQLLILGAQVTSGATQEEDVSRESRDLENNARLMLKVWNKRNGAYNSNMKASYDLISGDYIVTVKKNSFGRMGVGVGFNLVGGNYIEEVDPTNEMTQIQEFYKKCVNAENKLDYYNSLDYSFKNIQKLYTLTDNPKLQQMIEATCEHLGTFVEMVYIPLVEEMQEYIHWVDFENDQANFKKYYSEEDMKKNLVGKCLNIMGDVGKKLDGGKDES